MQRMKTAGNSERGAAAVLVAILMVVLLGFGALAVDVGLLYSEKAQLQNGADAGALGIAQACAKGTADCTTPSSLAKGLADANSLDGRSNVRSIVLDTRKVTVTTEPLEAGRSDNHVSLFFAGALGIPSSSAVAQSTVIWGSPRKAPVPFPMVISVCEVKGMLDGDIQLIESHSTPGNKAATCKEQPAGKDAPGGFGWLEQAAGTCSITVTTSTAGGENTTHKTAPGNEAPRACETTLRNWATEIEAGRDVIILLPTFKSLEGTGNNVIYTLSSFTAFSVKGWSFDGDGSVFPWRFRSSTAWAGANACTLSCRGIIGQFVKHVDLSSTNEDLGPVSPYGATVVKLTN